MKMLQRIAQGCLEFHISELYIASRSHLCRSRKELCKFAYSCQDLSNIYLKLLKAVNSHRFNQSDLDTRSWYHGMAASMECLQAPLCTPSLLDRSRLVPLTLDYIRLARSKTNREPVRRLPEGSLLFQSSFWYSTGFSIMSKYTVVFTCAGFALYFSIEGSLVKDRS